VGADSLIPALLAIVLALVAGCGDTAGRALPPNANDETARVDSVRDGDTILLTTGRRVRLVQVDAPELAVECYGDEAADALRRLAPAGTAIRLQADPGLDRTDKFGRLLRYVHVAGRNLNLELVRAGAAAPYFYRGVRGKYASALERAARRAHDERVGLWHVCPAARLVPGRAIATGPTPGR